MNIVLLDAATLGSDLKFNEIEQFGKLIVYQTTTTSQTKERIANANIVITNKVIIGKEEMDAAANLELICVAATGINNIDIDEAAKRNIKVANVKNV